MLQHFIKDDEFNIELLFIEDVQTKTDVLTQISLINTCIWTKKTQETRAILSKEKREHTIFGEPVRVQNGPLESSIQIGAREVFVTDTVEKLVCPLAFSSRCQSVLEEAEG